MTPSQRTILAALAGGATGFVVLFALGIGWPVAAILGLLLTVSVWSAANYLAPTDRQSELQGTFRQIEKTTDTIRALSARVTDPATASALLAGCDGIPGMIQVIGGRDIAVALPLAQRSLTYVTTVAEALRDYTAVQDGGDSEYLQMGRQELQRFAEFSAQPGRELSERRMEDYINSVTALNLTPPPELS